MRKLDHTGATLGEKLRALRRGQAVSLDMIEQKTRIQRRYLEALERGQYHVLPEPMYTRNFIRAYAQALNADESYFLDLYEEECGCCDLVAPLRSPRQRLRRMKLIVWNRLTPLIFGSFAVAGVALYLGWQIFSVTAPPQLVLFSPVNATVSEQAMILVEGYVEDEATIYVNGEQVVINDDSTFSAEVDLDRGLNTILIEAERRYSRRAKIERNIVFDPKEKELGPVLSTRRVLPDSEL